MGAPSGEQSRAADGGRAAARVGAAVAALVVLVLVVYGGYGEHWRWVGVSGATATLWDWLHLLLLPIAAVVLPLWLRHRPQLHGAVLAAVAALGAAFICVVLAGYLAPWAWTGLVGNTLWDWLNL